jgi:hypothetical protein
MIDVILFKPVKDPYGHPAGYEALEDGGQCLERLLPLYRHRSALGWRRAWGHSSTGRGPGPPSGSRPNS